MSDADIYALLAEIIDGPDPEGIVYPCFGEVTIVNVTDEEGHDARA